MASDEIIRMARDAGFGIGPATKSIYANTPCDDQLERFAALVAAAKQEQISSQWDALHEQYMADPLRRHMMLSYELVAQMIRGQVK